MSERKFSHHPGNMDHFYGEKDEVFKWGIKPLIGIVIAICVSPLFIIHGIYKGLGSLVSVIGELGDSFYYWSKVHYWGKYTPRYRRRMKSQNPPTKEPHGPAT